VKKKTVESKLYALIEALDIWPKSSTAGQNALVKKNNQHITHTSSQSKKCDNQCIDCFLLFCQREHA